MRVENGEIVFKSDLGENDACRVIDGAYFDKRRKEWRMPFDIEHLRDLSLYHELSEDVKQAGRDALHKKAMVEAARSATMPTDAPMPVSVDPWPHQVKGYEMALAQMEGGGGGFGLLFDMGTGKTLTAVGIAGRLFLEGRIDRVLVMAPSSVLPEWTKALERFADFEWAAAECVGTKDKREKALAKLAACDGKCSFAVINYESAWRTDAAILRYEPQLVICDESQRIKSHTAKQSKFAHRLERVAPYRLVLSGTPLQNSPLDFFSQYLFLDPSVFGTKWYGFKNRYSVQKSGFNSATKREFKQVVGYRNLDELSEKVHGIALRVENGVIDLPPEMPPVIRCAEFSTDEARAYTALRDESIAELEEGGTVVVPNALAKLLRLQQMTSGFTVNDEGEEVHVGDAKERLFDELVDEVVIENNEKLVVFFRFINDMKAIERVLKRSGVGYVSLYGGTKQDDRAAAVAEFGSDALCRVFVGQLQASGTGIDGLQIGCHTACFYSNSFNAADYEQAKARLNRSGQSKSCVFVHLVVRGTVDEHILEALKEKKSMAEYIVDRGALSTLG